jgi:hypothetical protein
VASVVFGREREEELARTDGARVDGKTNYFLVKEPARGLRRGAHQPCRIDDFHSVLFLRTLAF